MVVQGYVAQQCLLQIQPTLEAMAFEDIGNSPIEAFDHAIGARRSGLGQPVFQMTSESSLLNPWHAAAVSLNCTSTKRATSSTNGQAAFSKNHSMKNSGGAEHAGAFRDRRR